MLLWLATLVLLPFSMLSLDSAATGDEPRRASEAAHAHKQTPARSPPVPCDQAAVGTTSAHALTLCRRLSIFACHVLSEQRHQLQTHEDVQSTWHRHAALRAYRTADRPRRSTCAPIVFRISAVCRSFLGQPGGARDMAALVLGRP